MRGEFVTAGHLGGFHIGGDPDTTYPNLWAWLAETLHVGSVLDVGCGDGHALDHFKGLESVWSVVGIDGMQQEHSWIVQHDFTTGPADLEGFGVDLVWSCEFVEHVEAQYVDNFLPALASGRWLAMTHAQPGQTGHHHVNCVVEGTNVATAGDLQNAFRRRYVGQVVTLVTAEGDSLTVTPNHPILAARGWVAAGRLEEGDDLVDASLLQGVPGEMMPHPYERPAVVEKVFGAFEEVFPSGVLHVPGAAEQFHGDGSAGEVDVVRANGLLGGTRDSSRFEHRLQGDFDGGAMRETRFPSGGPGDEFVGRPLLPAHGGVKHLHPGGLLGWGEASPTLFQSLGRREAPQGESVDDREHGRFADANCGGDSGGRYPVVPHRRERALIDDHTANRSGVALAPDVDSMSEQEGFGCSEVGLGLAREFREGFPGDIALKKLASVHTSHYDGWVYNLSTDCGMYWADGVIVHNCQDSDYWVDQLARYGMVLDPYLTAQARAVASTDAVETNYFARTGLVFERGAS